LFNKQTVLVRCLKNYRLFLVPLLLTFSLATQAQVPLTRISIDSFTNSSSQHKTEVEPYVFAFGNTIVATFQQGRYPDDGGSSDNGWATSLDGGVTWQHGALPGLTALVGGTADRISDPSVTYDAAHGLWMIGSLPVSNSSSPITAMLVSRSQDGISWRKPVSVSPNYNKPDKTWINCDNNTSSPFYGHCYAEWDDNSNSDTIYFSVSNDGGIKWAPPVQPAGSPIGLGLQPLAQPNGTVIAAGSDAFLSNIIAVTSTNGGGSWSSQVTVSNITYHAANGGLRDLVLPSSAMDASGTIYVVWQDCRFRTGCNSNDLVMSTSTDGKTWTAVQRIPIDPVTSNDDHFIPGLAVEPGTSGASAHLGLTYYFYPNANCSSSGCQLEAGYISSTDGGSIWTASTTLTGMKLPWLPSSNQGSMVGDYESLVFVNGKALPVVAVAKANSGSTFNESMYIPTNGLEEGLALYSSAGDKPVPNAHSDHLPLATPACDNCGDRD
jgi:hypothetical protein